MYASADDVAAYLHTDVAHLPEDIDRLIEHATRMVRHQSWGRSDHEGNEEAVTEATCAQVEYWLETGEDTDIEGDNLRSYRIGNVEINRLLPSDAPDVPSRSGIAPRARRALLDAGLLYKVVQ